MNINTSIKVRFLIGICIFAVFVYVTKCNKSKDSTKYFEDGTVTVTDQDIAMNTAIQKALKNLGKFEKALEENKYSNYSLKVAFTAPDKSVEHIWLSNISFDGEQYTGTIGNDPMFATYLHFGDTIKVRTQDISDWIYFDYDKGEVHGGYTMQVIRSRMNDEEQALLDAELQGTFVDK